MSKETPFNAMMPPNTTLTSRTASRGAAEPAFPRAIFACVISSRLHRRVSRKAKCFAPCNDKRYLIPSVPPATLSLLTSRHLLLFLIATLAMRCCPALLHAVRARHPPCDRVAGCRLNSWRCGFDLSRSLARANCANKVQFGAESEQQFSNWSSARPLVRRLPPSPKKSTFVEPE